MPGHIQVGDAVPRVQYAANGSQTAFTFLFPIFTAADMEVWLDDVRQSPSAYSISGAGISAGGTVLFAVPPANGVLVTLRRRLAIARTSDYQDDGIIRAKVLNDELDYQIAAIQQVAEDAGRAVKRSFTSTSSADLTLPEPIAGKAIGWNAAGDALTNDPAEFAATVATVTAQAIAAASSASAAAASAATAATSATSASASAANAGVSATAAGASAASMTASVAACADSEAAAAASATTATTQAGDAATSAASASASAATATTQAGDAATSATSAATSATNAASSASSASASATTATTQAAEAAASAASLPNSSVGTGKVPLWNGSAWVGTDVGIGDLVAANNLSDVADAAAARGNLGAAAASHGHASADISDFTEAAQDVVGAMVVAAGGSYNDAAGTIAFPAGGGGAWEYVSTTVISSGASTAEITLPSGDCDFVVVINSLQVGTMGAALLVRWGTGAGPTWYTSTGHRYDVINVAGATMTSADYQTLGNTAFKIIPSMYGSSDQWNGTFSIDAAGLSVYHHVSSELCGYSGSDVWVSHRMTGMARDAQPLTGLQFYPSSGTFTVGKMVLLKRKRSA
jgi:hypothetical protein